MPTGKLNQVSGKAGVPLYVAVRDELKRAIDAGVFDPGEQLPSTKALSSELAVSLVTVHRALRELVNVGVVRRGQGRGTFVREDYGARAGASIGLRIALVFQAESSLADSYHGQILEGVRQGAETLGIDLVVLHFGEDWRNECQGFLYVNPLRRQVDRVVGPAGRSPVMIVGASFDDVPANCVDVDNIGLARRAVQKLAEAGHRRIAYVGGDEENSNSRHRWSGFHQACVEYGIEVEPDWQIRVEGWRLPQRERGLLGAMLASATPPTAVFAAGYYFALDVYGVAGELGLQIPGDLSVVGVDDPPSAEFLSPPLTTMRQPLTEMGRIAVANLFDVIGQQAAPRRRVLLSAEWVGRGSVRRVAGEAGTIVTPLRRRERPADDTPRTGGDGKGNRA